MSCKRQVSKKISSTPVFYMLFMLCWLSYFATYLGRLNYSASLTEIIQSEGMSKGMAGLIGTGFFCAYGIGQLVNGFLGDKWSPKWMVFTGILVSGVVNLIMGRLYEPTLMVAIWAINGFIQSLIWSPIIRIFADKIPKSKQKAACVHINSCVPIGTFAAYGLTALTIWIANWRSVFFNAGWILIAMSTIWFTGMTYIEKYTEKYGIIEEEEIKLKNDQTESIYLRKVIISSGILFLCVSLMMQGVLKDGVTTWIPTYITEIFNFGSAASIISTTVIPLFNLSGVYLAAYVNKKYFANEIATAGFFFLVCAGAVIMLRLFPDTSISLSLILFGIATTAMMAVNTMLISVVPIYFAKYGKSSSISGILNSSAYVGGALSTYGIGAISVAYGWHITIVIWAFCAVIGCIGCIIGKKYWNTFIKVK